MKISDRAVRKDAKDKISGRAKYIEDRFYEGLLYARTLRATQAHALIKEIRYPRFPNGVYKVDSKDIIFKNEVSMIDCDMPIFANKIVRYAGEPIALIVGEDKDQVLDFMKRIEIDYMPLEGQFDLDSASEDKENILTQHKIVKGNLDKVDYDFKLEEKFETPYQEQLYMEKQGMVGRYESGVLVVEGSMQCPYYILNALKHMSGWDEDKLRVIQTTTGGAFGGKEEYPSLLACQVAIAAYKLKQPVQLVFDRREDIAFTTKRHPSTTHVVSYIKDNKIVGMQMDIKLDAGGYLGLSDVVLQRAMLTMTGAYKIDNLKITGKTVRTNNVFTGAFRGFGAPQSLFALEMHMTHVATRLGIDPMVFRKMHFVVKGDQTSTSGIFHDEIVLETLAAEVERISGYPIKQETDERWVGYGCSVVPHGGGFTGDGEATHIKATVKLRKEVDDSVTILVSNVEMGQGAMTVLSKIVASALEIELEQVHYETPDTWKVPDSGPTVASRTTMIVGELLLKAAMALKKHMGEPKTITITKNYEKPAYIVWDQESFKGNAYLSYSWVAMIVRVEVNPVTYEVKCTDIWGTYDVGRAIDKDMALGQVHGGIVQGLGYAMMEHMSSDKGFIEQIAFSSYPIPTPMDIPRMNTLFVDNPYADGPYGAKAIGELTLVGVAPAVATAIEDAMKREVYTIPVTPEIIERTLRPWKDSF